MSKLFLFLCLCGLIYATGCTPQAQRTTIEATKQDVFLDKTLYDSIQNFVSFHHKWNLRSDIFLLEILDQQQDTTNFVLTTILSKQDIERHIGCPSFYNKDSSVVIVDNKSQLLFDQRASAGDLYKKIGNNHPDEAQMPLYNPLSWKVSFVKGQVLVDRDYGRTHSPVAAPKAEFHPPQ